MTKFGIEDVSSRQMLLQSIREATRDISIKDIDAVVLSTSDISINGERQKHYSSLLTSLLKKRMPIITVPAVCGGGGASLWTANKLGYDNILVVATEKVQAGLSTAITDEILQAADRIWEQYEGLVFPAQNALVAQQHMLKYGTKLKDLSLIAYKNHKNATRNPKAMFYKKEVSLKKIMKSPTVASPLRLYDCSISVNGAAAVVLSRDKTDIKIVGSGLGTDTISTFERPDPTVWTATIRAAEAAYSEAGLTPDDIDFAEIHDAFTIVELIAYEDLGFCKKGEGKNMIRDGIVEIDGKLPVNPCGGLKAKGHPISPTGIAQVVEITEQLRNEAGDRQLASPKTAIAQNIGGAGGTVTVNILKKVGA